MMRQFCCIRIPKKARMNRLQWESFLAAFPETRVAETVEYWIPFSEEKITLESPPNLLATIHIDDEFVGTLRVGADGESIDVSGDEATVLPVAEEIAVTLGSRLSEL